MRLNLYVEFMDEIQQQELAKHYLQLGAYLAHCGCHDLEIIKQAETYLEKSKNRAQYNWSKMILAFVWHKISVMTEKRYDPEYKINFHNCNSYASDFTRATPSGFVPVSKAEIYAFAKYVVILNYMEEGEYLYLDYATNNLAEIIELYKSIDMKDARYDHLIALHQECVSKLYDSKKEQLNFIASDLTFFIIITNEPGNKNPTASKEIYKRYTQ
jgi:hypothetical protein